MLYIHICYVHIHIFASRNYINEKTIVKSRLILGFCREVQSLVLQKGQIPTQARLSHLPGLKKALKPENSEPETFKTTLRKQTPHAKLIKIHQKWIQFIKHVNWIQLSINMY